MYHPYKDGYSTLPNLGRIEPEEVWERDPGSDLMEEKERVLASRGCYFESDCSLEVLDNCAAWISAWHPRHPVGDFQGAARQIPEDVMVHRVVDGRDWLAAAHVCFPSHWDPLEKVGRSYEEIHRPVPMNLANSGRIVRAMCQDACFERFVWSVVHDRRFDFHPSKPSSSFSPGDPFVLVKVERQVTVGFPSLGCCLFVLRQYLLEDFDREYVARAIEGMTPEQRSYKGLTEPGHLLEWLRSSAGRSVPA